MVIKKIPHLSFYWFSFTMDHSVGSNNTIRVWVRLYNFELYCSHPSSHEKNITLPYWSVSFQEIWFQINLKKISEEQNKYLLIDFQYIKLYDTTSIALKECDLTLHNSYQQSKLQQNTARCCY